jgi:hypothetical protein
MMTEPHPRHLDSDEDDPTALALSADVYSGNYTELEVWDRLISNIHRATGFQYRSSGSIPIGVVAMLIKNVWAHMDREPRDDGVEMELVMQHDLVAAHPGAQLLRGSPDGVFVAPFEQGEIGPDLFRAACGMGLEGLVSKRRDRAYRGGRCAHWVKVRVEGAKRSRAPHLRISLADLARIPFV